jgi:hypothetical protein
MASCRLFVQIEAARPNGTLLASRIASSGSSKGVIARTGPKTGSFWMTRHLPAPYLRRRRVGMTRRGGGEFFVFRALALLG